MQCRNPGSIPGSGRSAGEGIGYSLQYSWASLVAQLVKNPLAMRKTWVGKIPWRMEQLPTPVFWPGEFHGLYNPWGHKELDMTKQLSLSTSFSGKRIPLIGLCFPLNESNSQMVSLLIWGHLKSANTSHLGLNFQWVRWCISPSCVLSAGGA